MACKTANLELFDRPLIESSIDKTIDGIEYYPISAEISDCVEFILHPEVSMLYDLGRLYMYTRLQVTKADGNPIEKDIFLVPLFCNALWFQLDVTINNNTVSSQSGYYGYSSYLTTLLSYPKNVKDELLAGLCYFNGLNVPANYQEEIETLVPVHTDLCHQGKYILNGCEIRLKFTRASDAFVIQRKDASDSEKYRIKLQKVILYACKILPNPSVLLEHAKRLATTNACYPIDRIYVKCSNIAAGLVEVINPNLFLGHLPKRIIIGLVNASATSGNYVLNPFKFEHFDLESVQLTVNGEKVPNSPLETNFEKKLLARAYYNLLDVSLGPCVDTRALGISIDDFRTKFPLFAFAVNPILHSTSQEATLPNQTGIISIRLLFRKPLAQAVTMVCLSESEGLIEIDSSRTVYVYP
jgi:hypothetical protein